MFVTRFCRFSDGDYVICREYALRIRGEVIVPGNTTYGLAYRLSRVARFWGSGVVRQVLFR